MITEFKKGEPLKNSLKTKIISLMSLYYGGNNSKVKRMKYLFINYKFTFQELLNMLSGFEKFLNSKMSQALR